MKKILIIGREEYSDNWHWVTVEDTDEEEVPEQPVKDYCSEGDNGDRENLGLMIT